MLCHCAHPSDVLVKKTFKSLSLVQDQNLTNMLSVTVLHSGCLYRHQREIEADTEKERPTDPQTSCQICPHHLPNQTYVFVYFAAKSTQWKTSQIPKFFGTQVTSSVTLAAVAESSRLRGGCGPHAFQGLWCINAFLLERELVLLTSLIQNGPSIAEGSQCSIVLYN